MRNGCACLPKCNLLFERGEKKAMKIKLAQDDGDKDVMKLKREEIGKEGRVGVGDGNRERNTTTQ